MSAHCMHNADPLSPETGFCLNESSALGIILSIRASFAPHKRNGTMQFSITSLLDTQEVNIQNAIVMKTQHSNRLVIYLATCVVTSDNLC